MDYYPEQPWLPFSELLMEWEEKFHKLMLNDHLRMVAYETAIKSVVKQGDVVLDLGAGTGILSQWALEAGAKKVYAIEMDLEILKIAVQRIIRFDFSERFIPINRLSYEVSLPEKVDVVISEIIGNLADNEDFQPIIQDALKRFLKPGGRAIPQSVFSYIVPIASDKAYQCVKTKNIATLDPSKYSLAGLLKDKHSVNPFNMYYDTVLPSTCYLSKPEQLKCYEGQWDQPSVYSLDMKFVIDRPGMLTGFKGYFVANLAKDVLLDISGDDIIARTASDSWKHAYLPIEMPIAVHTGDVLHLAFSRFNPPESRNYFRQIYRWQGFVERGSEIIGKFDQCLDESQLNHHQSQCQPSVLPSLA
jgi:protein arginine N-methyltransferase 1